MDALGVPAAERTLDQTGDLRIANAVHSLLCIHLQVSLGVTLQNLGSLRQSISQWYFKPRAWETYNRGAVYVHLGVRIYKKYLPTSGDLITRARGIKRLKVAGLGRRAALERHRNQTCVWEWRHLISAILLQSWAIFAWLKFGVAKFWVSTVINIFVNIYPIMLQRFTRARIKLCLGKMQPK